jgi:hypothetical protein
MSSGKCIRFAQHMLEEGEKFPFEFGFDDWMGINEQIDSSP